MRYKTSIASILWAIIIYLQAKSIIWQDEAQLFASLLVAGWLSVNLYTNGKKR